MNPTAEGHDRITSMHLKDRKKDNGPNMPWGQGDTPIKEVLQLMRKENFCRRALGAGSTTSARRRGPY